jgi:hypothetical protein
MKKPLLVVCRKAPKQRGETHSFDKFSLIKDSTGKIPKKGRFVEFTMFKILERTKQSFYSMVKDYNISPFVLY